MRNSKARVLSPAEASRMTWIFRVIGLVLMLGAGVLLLIFAWPRMQLATVLFIVPAIVWIVLVVTATSLVKQLQNSGIV